MQTTLQSDKSVTPSLNVYNNIKHFTPQNRNATSFYDAEDTMSTEAMCFARSIQVTNIGR